jgi:mono/diheme cytochrome c family protein
MRIASAGAAMAAVLLLAGCRQDMQDQPKFFPQRGTTFPGMSGRSVRPQVENTVARNQMHEDEYFYTGLVDGKEGDGLPIALTPEVMARGQERYNIYCTPCHSRVGNGQGMIVQRGYRPAGDFQEPYLLEKAHLGHFFNVMTNGYGAMPDYSAQLTPEDRWAIVAYIKALQLSQNAKPADAVAGAQIESLANISEREGLPANFASEWGLPPTAVYGTPNNQDNGIPAEVQGTGKAAGTPASTGNMPAAPGK